jgi:hypothetical protein
LNQSDAPAASASPNRILSALKAVQPFLLPGAFALILLGSLLAPFVGSKPRLEILAAVAPQGDDSVVITGRVLHDGRGFRGATVVAVANTRLGNEYSAEGKTQGGPQATAASDPGAFELVLSRKVAPGPGPRPSFVRTITSVTIRASNDDNTLDGTDLLTVSRADQFHQIEFSLAAVAPITGLFVFGIFWAFRRPDDFMQRRFQYYISVFSAVALTTAMIVLIAISLKNINTRGGELGGGRRNVVLSMGFAHVFKGTYVRGVDPEWLFSFTTYRVKPQKVGDDDVDAATVVSPAAQAAPVAPSDGGTSPAVPAGKAVIVPKPASEPAEKAASTEEPTIQGLGAPLWVLLMSVLGAAVLTISMVVSWVRDPLDFSDEKGLRQRLENIVRHQFYVIFAPIGSVFVYQALIVSQAASQPLAVGIAAFGSGMALNRLLDVALDAATKYWPKATTIVGAERTVQLAPAVAAAPVDPRQERGPK